MKYLTKKNVVVLFLLFLIFAVSSMLLDSQCDQFSWCPISNPGYISESLGYVLLFILYVTPLLLPVVLTLPLKKQVFEIWKKFAVVAIPAVLAIDLYLYNMSLNQASGFAPGSDLWPAIISLFLYGGYFLVSFVVIGVAWWKSRR